MQFLSSEKIYKENKVLKEFRVFKGCRDRKGTQATLGWWGQADSGSQIMIVAGCRLKVG
jgi:hypothetical protein